MSVEVLPFRVDDLNWLDVQDRHKDLVEQALSMPGPAQRCMEGKWSFTGWSADGRALWCIGVYDNELWGFLAKDLKKHMISLHRWGRRMLPTYFADSGPVLVDCTFDEAVRLAQVLGCRHIGGVHWIFDEKCSVR